MNHWKTTLTRRLLVAVVATMTVASLATYEFTKPARAASAAPAAAPLDDNSVAALLTLDRAMETLAARVTPAVVNVTVTSKGSAQQGGEDSADGDLQQFFGPFGNNPFGGTPFGRQFRRMQPQQRVEHGLGSGVIISPMATSLPIITSSMELLTSGSR